MDPFTGGFQLRRYAMITLPSVREWSCTIFMVLRSFFLHRTIRRAISGVARTVSVSGLEQFHQLREHTSVDAEPRAGGGIVNPRRIAPAGP